MELDVNRVIEIIKEEHPMVYELAVRRAIIEQLNLQIEQMNLAKETVA